MWFLIWKGLTPAVLFFLFTIAMTWETIWSATYCTCVPPLIVAMLLQKLTCQPESRNSDGVSPLITTMSKKLKGGNDWSTIVVEVQMERDKTYLVKLPVTETDTNFPAIIDPLIYPAIARMYIHKLVDLFRQECLTSILRVATERWDGIDGNQSIISPNVEIVY